MKKDKKIIPDKLFYSISEVSKITGVESYVLRYWESEFKILNPQKNLGGQRTYRKKDIDVISKIKELLYEQKFTIAGAKKKLRDMKESNFQLEFNDDNAIVDGRQKVVPQAEVLSKLKSQLKSLLDFLDSGK